MFKFNSIFCFIVTLGSACTIGNVYADDGSRIFVGKDVKHDVSLPLRYLQAKSNTLSHHTPIKQIIADASGNRTILNKASLIPLDGFQGMGVGLGSYVPSVLRPDTNGSVGMTQYVQWTEPDIAVFDKATGQVAPGFPKPGNSIWAGFGGFCETNAAGFMTMKYDQLAHRWLITQYANGDFQTGPFYQCVALSTSEDATGSYYRYAFQFDSFSSTPRSALWTNGYYFSFETSGRLSNGPRACALERDKMLQGLPASIQCEQLPQLTSAGSLIPADLEGDTLPPVDNPAYYLGLDGTDKLILYKYHVDFDNPLNTNISSIHIPVDVFTRSCSATNGQSCAIQPNTTNRLDVVSSSIMRLIYRKFANYGSMVATHTIEGPQPKFAPAIRWYEFRVLDSSPSFNPIVFQSATFAPDSMNRFVGSIDIDKMGGIAIGYTVTSSLVFPSIELAYRNVDDPLETLTLQPLVTGTGSQINGVSAWGVSSKIAIDPVDNCTFWHNNEYLQSTGSMNWSTFIVHFKLADCQ